MKVYHGSYTEITEVDLSKCEKNKDFGQGFYVTKNRKHAEESTELHKKTWQEIYEMLKVELNKK